MPFQQLHRHHYEVNHLRNSSPLWLDLLFFSILWHTCSSLLQGIRGWGTGNELLDTECFSMEIVELDEERPSCVCGGGGDSIGARGWRSCAKLVTEQKWGFVTAVKSSTRIRSFAKQALAIKYNRMTFTIQHIQLRSKMSWTSLFIWLCVYFQTHLSSYSRTASLHNARKDSYVSRTYIYPPESQKDICINI